MDCMFAIRTPRCEREEGVDTMNEESLHLKLENVKKLSGFLMADMLPGQYGWILTRAFVHSDQKEFYKYINQISNIYLKDLLLDEIHAFLVIIHQDLSADVYVNSLPIEYQIMAKRDLQRYVRKDDIADINALRFKGLEIKPDDNVIFCFKKGWKFGLFFDFTSYGEDSLMDVESLYRELGKHYKYLMFQDEYAILEHEATFEPMFEDGWFPFSQLLGGEFQSLSTFYKDKEKFAGLIDNFLDSFNEKRINSFVSNWWRSPIFKEKQTIIESGIKSYLSGDYISCIKNLYSEIEGYLTVPFFLIKNDKI